MKQKQDKKEWKLYDGTLWIERFDPNYDGTRIWTRVLCNWLLWLQEHLEANDESKIGNTDGTRQFKSETLVRYIIYKGKLNDSQKRSLASW